MDPISQRARHPHGLEQQAHRADRTHDVSPHPLPGWAGCRFPKEWFFLTPMIQGVGFFFDMQGLFLCHRSGWRGSFVDSGMPGAIANDEEENDDLSTYCFYRWEEYYATRRFALSAQP